MEQRWYALRFPAGGSGFIIDSELLENFFHAAQPHDVAFQSFIIVCKKHAHTHKDTGKRITITKDKLIDAMALLMKDNQGTVPYHSVGSLPYRYSAVERLLLSPLFFLSFALTLMVSHVDFSHRCPPPLL